REARDKRPEEPRGERGGRATAGTVPPGPRPPKKPAPPTCRRDDARAAPTPRPSAARSGREERLGAATSGPHRRLLDEVVDDGVEVLRLAEDAELAIGARSLGEDLADPVEVVVRAEDVAGLGDEVEQLHDEIAR